MPAVTRGIHGTESSSVSGSSGWRCRGAGACDGVEDGARRGLRVRQRCERRGQRAVVVVGDDLVDEPAHGREVLDRVEAAGAHELADRGLDRVDHAHSSPLRDRP